MRQIALLPLLITLCVCAPYIGHAETPVGRSSSEEVSGSSMIGKVAELRSLLLKAELSGDREACVQLGREILRLTDDVDPGLPRAFLVAVDRLLALKALYVTYGSLAREELAAQAQEQVVALTEAIYANDPKKLLCELDELALCYGDMGRMEKQSAVLNRALELARRIGATTDEIHLLSGLLQNQVNPSLATTWV